VHRIGRTGRIGHVGTAISFYNARNEDIAQDLVNTLVEQSQEVPDFLMHLKSEDGKVTFDDDSDDDAGDAKNDEGVALGKPLATGAGNASGWGSTQDTAGGAENDWGINKDADVAAESSWGKNAASAW